jgi:DNA-binding LacI/PurR family transcriptional regulator
MRSMQPKRVTIPDLARELGLSVGTVSNALNGNHGQVSSTTISRVSAAAKRLGYRRNRAASTLRTGLHGAISIFIPGSVRSVQFYMDFTMGAAEATSRDGIDLLLVTSPAASGSSVPVDGALVVDWLPEVSASTLSYGESVPLFSAGDVPPGSESVPSLSVDYYGQTSRLVRAALASGAQRPAMIAPDSSFNSAWARSICQAFSDSTNGAPITRIPVDSNQEGVASTCSEIFDRSRPDFVIFGPQRFAGIASLMLGWGKPGSDVPWIASCAADPLTELHSRHISGINANPRRFGYEAASRLLERITAASGRVGLTSNEPEPPLHATHPSTIQWADHWRE